MSRDPLGPAPSRLEMVRLYRRLAPCVVRRCELILRDSSAAAEGCQVIFAELFRAGRPLRGPRLERDWLLARARSHCLEQLRLHRPRLAPGPRCPRLSNPESPPRSAAPLTSKFEARALTGAHPAVGDLEAWHPAAHDERIGSHLRGCARCRRLLRLLQAKSVAHLASTPLPDFLSCRPSPWPSSALPQMARNASAGRAPGMRRVELARRWRAAESAVWTTAESLAVDPDSGCIWVDLKARSDWTIAADAAELSAHLEGVWFETWYPPGALPVDLGLLGVRRLPAVDRALEALAARLEPLGWNPRTPESANPELRYPVSG